MKNIIKYVSIILATLLGCTATVDNKLPKSIVQTEQDTVRHNFITFDSLELPSQLIRSPGSERTILFLNGSTPYDEKGNMGQLLPGNIMIKNRQDFYARFLDIMLRKGYDIATFAKRSFTYPSIRPSLDELALDAQHYVNDLEKRGLLKDLVIVGYSEGSIVATKLLPLIDAQACILLGSASQEFDFFNGSWEDWPTGKAYQRIDGLTGEQIKLEYEQWSDIMRSLTTMDEAYFENVYKKSNPHGFGFSPWESFRIDREVQFYNPTENVVNSGLPLLIVIGENDRAMPVELAERTYNELIATGHNAHYHMIPGESHQYNKYDVFLVMHSWLNREISLEPDNVDKEIVERYTQLSSVTSAINDLPWERTSAHIDSLYREAVRIGYDLYDNWFKLGLVLFGNDYLDESLGAFERASDPDFVLYYAALVWQGHINDMFGNREQALDFYRQGLDNYPGFPVQHDQWGMVLSDEYIKNRLENPFKGIE